MTPSSDVLLVTLKYESTIWRHIWTIPDHIYQVLWNWGFFTGVQSPSYFIKCLKVYGNGILKIPIFEHFKKGIFEIRVTVASFLGSKTVAKAYYDHHPTSLHICSHEKYKQSSYTKWLFCGGFLELGRSFWNLRFLKDFCRFL